MQPVKEPILGTFRPSRIRLELSIRDVVDDGVAGNEFQGVRLRRPVALLANDHAQFKLPIDVVRRHLGNANRVARIVERGGRRLHEDVREGRFSLGCLPPAFLDVLRVVSCQQEQFGGIGNRHLDLDRLGRNSKFGDPSVSLCSQRFLQGDDCTPAIPTGQECRDPVAIGHIDTQRRCSCLQRHNALFTVKPNSNCPVVFKSTESHLGSPQCGCKSFSRPMARSSVHRIEFLVCRP